ncbi:MAG: two-component regulator propeller domain-containing protein [Candidatus Saccharibacteria bacterium]
MKPNFQARAIVLFLLVIRLASPALSQQFYFNKVLHPDGNTIGQVFGIIQDLNGYMWFSTDQGLYSYDGYQMTLYTSNLIDPNSLSSESLGPICLDNTGKIWIGTLGSGLECFDPVTGKFKHYRHSENNPSSINGDWLNVLMIDHEGDLWIGTGVGLDRFDKQTGSFIHYRNNPDDSTSISYNEVMAIYEDRQGTIWVGTGSVYGDKKDSPEIGGLNRMNKKNGTFTRYMHDPENPNSLINNKVSAIFEDSNGIFWVGTAGDGLHTMDREKGTFKRHRYDPLHPEKLSRPPINKQMQKSDFITFIIEDITGALWIGTSYAGINYYNPKTSITRHFESQKEHENEGAFFDNTAWCAYTSKEGVVWIASFNHTLYSVDPLRKQIPHYEIPGGGVNSFYEEPNGILWIGTEKELIRRDQEKGIIKRYQLGSANGIRSINLIEKSRPGYFWIGGHGGLYLWNISKENFTNYKNDPKDEKSLSNTIVLAIKEDNDSNLWVGTAKGLNFLDRKSGAFTRYSLDPTDTTTFGRNIVSSILLDKDEKLWVSTWYSGIMLFNKETKDFRNFLPGTNVTCIQDRDGTLWAGSTSGLYRFDRKAGKFLHYEDPNSLIRIPFVLSMVEDKQKCLWLGTSLGIVKINPQRNETTLYGKNYGVKELGYNSIYLGRHGELYFGNATGYFKFLPNQLTNNIRPPEIHFTNFLLENQIVKAGIHSPLQESLSQVKKIQLHYNQNVFSFEFVAIDYANPKENRHFYMLENYDSDWHPANSERRAYYFNIPPGKYVFRVKAANSYGIWAEKKVDIEILPPWWRTWWAYCMYALLFIACVIGLARFQRTRLLKAETERTRQRELSHAKEIEKAYTELKATQTQLIQAEKMASLGELTAGIAHEIQNPLNFVNNFSEVNTELIEEMKEELEKGNMDEVKSIAEDIAGNEKKIAQHGKRADSIVKGMLLHSRSSSGIKEPTDINALADEFLRLTYHGLKAKDKSFNATMKSDFDPSIGKINVTAQEMGRVLMNLLNNAFYAVNEKRKLNMDGYEPTVTVSTRKLKDKVEIKVSDNGNGIPQTLLDKVFQPFFTTKPSGEGTGLGLSLSYDIVTKGHGGELKVDTKEGEYTTFIIDLPV